MTATGRAASRGPLIESNKTSCRECWGCVRYCPARAIRVVDRVSAIIQEKCVRCGLCVSECGHAGHTVRDDTPAVWALLESGRPVVAVLATEFVAAMHPLTPAEVERELERLGFYSVESTVLGEEMVAIAYANVLKRECAFPVLRSTCPVVVEWVRRYHPSLTQALAPIVPPYIAQARLVKALYPNGTAVVYVSPCYARKDEIADPQLSGAIDVAIDFTEVTRMIEEGRERPLAPEVEECGAQRPMPVKELSLTDGFPRAMVADASLAQSDIQVVRGLRALDRLLFGIERGEAGPVVVDMLNCEGCIDGPAVSPGMSLFAKRNVEAAERVAAGRSVVSSRELLRHLPAVDLVRSFHAHPVVVPEPSEREIDEILAEGEFPSREATIDCGACGYGACVEHAVAIYQGNSSWDMCFPLQRERLSRRVSELSEHETLDALTGLWNRRILGERLADEVARHARYGAPISLLMIDVDGLKAVNDRHGREGGDAVLTAIGAHLRQALRVTDLTARYGDDEFAVVLPGMNKTGAFAVAEKLRASISDLRAALDGGEEPVRFVGMTVSVGVASASPAITDASALLEAADSALYQAKDAGRDQVRLASD